MGLVARQSAILLGGVTLLAAAMQPGIAQDNQVHRTHITLLERLVIGAGAEKIAIDTPQAVTVLDQEALDAAQATTIGEFFQTVPGVAMIGADRAFGQAFNIRGIGAAESGDESKIVVTVDGAPKFFELYRVGSFFSDPELYKSVEVLRGPASSTLYGSGALAGVVNFTTKDASDFLQPGMMGAMRLKAAYDSNGNGTLTSGIWAHEFSEGFEVLAAGNWRRSNDFLLADGTTLTGSAFDAWSGLLKATGRFGDRDEQVVRLSYQHWDSDAQNQDYSQTGTISMFGTVDRHVIDRTAVLSYENPASDNPWLDVKASISYSDTSVAQSNASLGAPFMNADYGYGTWSGNAQNTITYSADDFENFFTFGLQASHQVRTAAPLAPPPVIGTHPEGTQSRVGIFAQNEYIWNDTLTLIGGARVDFNRLDPSSNLVGAVTTEDVAFSPKIAALYKLSDNFTVFGSIAHTERFPTLDEVFSVSGARGMNFGLEKESSDNFELGFAVSAYDLMAIGDSLSLKTTAYYNNVTNLIQSSAAPYYYDNLGHARLYGVEIEGAYNSEYVFANLAWTIGYGVDAATGAALATIPAHKLVATLGGRLPENDLEFGVRGTFAADAPNGLGAMGTPGTPGVGYQTYDLFASWTPQTGLFEGSELRLSVDNLFDTDYRDNLSIDRSRGRTFKLSLARQFDY